MKAICSFSGGLDSMLAARIMLEQGIDVEAVHFHNGFGGCGEKEGVERSLRRRAGSLGIELTFMDVREDLIRILRAPEFGFGKNMNPCMDCHLLFFRKCGEYMEEAGASFIVTGEVLGERPMSQRKHAMELIDRNSGFGGLILRPLSAKLLEPTVAEKKGWVDRGRLFAISGRSRRPQRQLAAEFGIDDYPNAAGGCLLTEKEFSRKLRDLMGHKRDIDVTDIDLLKSGRHFRISPGTKLILGRDEKENESLFRKAPGGTCFVTVDVPGPVGIVRGQVDRDEEALALKIISAYSNIMPGRSMEISRVTVPEGKVAVREVGAVAREDVKKYLI